MSCIGCNGEVTDDSTHQFTADDFIMRIDNPYVTPHSTELFYTMTVLNDVPDAEITYGESFVIEQHNEDGSWTRALPASELTAFTLMAYHIYGHSVCESIPINNDLYGSLSEGHYRLLKYINGDIPVTAEFDVIPSDISFELFGADNVTTETQLLQYTLSYQGDGTREYMCGIEYTLEKRNENGDWIYVQPDGYFTQIGYHLSERSPENTFACAIADGYKEAITNGRYRLNVEIFNQENLITQDRKSHILYERFSEEFTIS